MPSSLADGLSRGRRRNKEFVGAVGDTGSFPGKAPEGHAGENDSKRPDVSGLWVIFGEVVNFGGEVGVRSNDAYMLLLAQKLVPSG